ncbi:MAG TPA: YfiR family protein [Methylotenera sp.]|nr:YfiR family protein [Methylotenera sp.]
MGFLNLIRTSKQVQHMHMPFYARQLLKALAFIYLFIATTFINPVLADESLEYGVKAAFLYKFGSYVEWPSTAFESPNSPITLCVFGSNDQFISTLEKVIGTESINNRSVNVRPIKSVDRNLGCHILYIDSADGQHSPQIIENLRGTSVLTVNNDGVPSIIDFVISNNRVRFNIDDDAAAQNGLTISSKLLSVALKVKKRSSKGS